MQVMIFPILNFSFQTLYPLVSTLALFHFTIGEYLTDKSEYVEYTLEEKNKRYRKFVQRDNEKRPNL